MLPSAFLIIWAMRRFRWCSIHAVISEEQLWERVERLKAIGAEGILILALENMIR